jgi:AcrR family transcriptional regulator
MSPRPSREERRPDLQTAIKETAWHQIAELGATALNLRAIARDLGITAPSIYNYFPNRDALVTALIVDAFSSLADAQEEALLVPVENEHATKLAALGLAYRQWAVTYPQRYQLIFGTPIPNYHAPDEITLPAAARALIPLTRTIQAIYSAGDLRTERFAALTPKLEAMLSAWQAFAGGADLEVLYLALVVWSRVHGLVMLEIGGHIPPFLDDPSELFQREINNLLIQYL